MPQSGGDGMYFPQAIGGTAYDRTKAYVLRDSKPTTLQQAV